MTKNKKCVLYASIAIILITSGCSLLIQTLNIFYLELPAWLVVCLSMVSTFLYLGGVTCMGRSVNLTQKLSGNGILFALLLIAAGLLLLGLNTGFFPPLWKGFFFSWQMLLFMIGSICLWRRHFISGIVFLSVGVLFLTAKANTIYPDIINEQLADTYWPVFIVVTGLLIIFSIILKPKRCKSQQKKTTWKESYTTNDSRNQEGKISDRLAFSVTEQVILDPVFNGGDINITFGGMELDLRRTTLPEGETMLYVKTTFGGVEITAPESWDIEVHSDTFVGGTDDSRPKNIERDKSRKLIIVSKCRFGGLVIQ